MDASVPTDSPSSRQASAWRYLLPASWQFSIREVLLLTAAVAAFLAWAGLFYQRSLPFSATAIPVRLRDDVAVREMCKSLGHQPLSYGGGSTGESNLHGCTYSYDRQLDFPISRRGEFMFAYHALVEKILTENADRVWGNAVSSDGQGLRGFAFNYSKGSVGGVVFVCCSDGKDELGLFTVVREYQASR